MKFELKLKIDPYALVDEAVGDGIAVGWQRYNKYSGDPASSLEQQLRDSIEEHATDYLHREIMNMLNEIVDWGDDEGS